MSRFTVVGAVLFVAALTASAQDGISFKSHIPKAGDRFKVTIEKKSVSKTTIDIKGQIQNKDELKSESLVYVEETVENADQGKKANKLKRTYEKVLTGTDKPNTAMSIQGKTVLIEKKDGKDGKYTFTVDGKPVADDAAKTLDEEFNKAEKTSASEIFMPKTPVKMGDSWKIDPEEIFKIFNELGWTFDKAKSKAGATLTKSYMKNGAQYGAMTFTFEAPITSLGPKVPIMVSEAKMTMKTDGDGCFDGSWPDGKTTSKVVIAFKGSVMGQADVVSNNEITETKTTEALKK